MWSRKENSVFWRTAWKMQTFLVKNFSYRHWAEQFNCYFLEQKNTSLSLLESSTRLTTVRNGRVVLKTTKKKNDILRTFWQIVCVAIELLLGLEYKTTWTLPLVFGFMVNSVENCLGIANKKKHSYRRRVIYVSIL